jgi:diphthamide synthase (EF-2-diphthine--ammonia ligase)
MNKTLMNWSGGKDSALALWRILQSGHYAVDTLFTTLNAANRRVSMHGVREELLDAQAERLKLPQTKLFLPEDSAMADYQQHMDTALEPLVRAGITHAVFGDIFLEDLRTWRETQLARWSLTGGFSTLAGSVASVAGRVLGGRFQNYCR